METSLTHFLKKNPNDRAGLFLYHIYYYIFFLRLIISPTTSIALWSLSSLLGTKCEWRNICQHSGTGMWLWSSFLCIPRKHTAQKRSLQIISQGILFSFASLKLHRVVQFDDNFSNFYYEKIGTAMLPQNICNYPPIFLGKALCYKTKREYRVWHETSPHPLRDCNPVRGFPETNTSSTGRPKCYPSTPHIFIPPLNVYTFLSFQIPT